MFEEKIKRRIYMKILSRIFVLILIILMGYLYIFDRNSSMLSLLMIVTIFSTLLFSKVFNKKEE